MAKLELVGALALGLVSYHRKGALKKGEKIHQITLLGRTGSKKIDVKRRCSALARLIGSLPGSDIFHLPVDR